jgi:hypothetical protein
VNIGAPNNSVSDFSRQIRHGISAQDLEYHGGELSFGDNGTLELNGEPGISGAIQDDLLAIVGQARALPLFSTVTGPGNNATFTIVGFRGSADSGCEAERRYVGQEGCYSACRSG